MGPSGHSVQERERALRTEQRKAKVYQAGKEEKTTEDIWKE